jgi:hypothetical protein
MKLPYDILFNVCVFLNYRELICLCTTGKQYYTDYKKKDRFYKKQLTEFEKYSCPLVLLDDEKYSVYDGLIDELNDLYEKSHYKKDIDNKFRDISLFLQKNNIFNKKGILPYIDNKTISCEFENIEVLHGGLPRDADYFNCIIEDQFDILLYADIVSDEDIISLLEYAEVDINWTPDSYRTNKCIKSSTNPSVYRLCWNINTLDSKINYDKNALWIPIINPKKYNAISIKFFKEVNCVFKIIGIKHDPIREYSKSSIGILLRPRISYSNACIFVADQYTY